MLVLNALLPSIVGLDHTTTRGGQPKQTTTNWLLQEPVREEQSSFEKGGLREKNSRAPNSSERGHDYAVKGPVCSPQDLRKAKKSHTAQTWPGLLAPKPCKATSQGQTRRPIREHLSSREATLCTERPSLLATRAEESTTSYTAQRGPACSLHVLRKETIQFLSEATKRHAETLMYQVKH